MNAYCQKCGTRTEHRRTQFGSYFRFFCLKCDRELIDQINRDEFGVPRPPRRFDLPVDPDAVTYPPRGG